MHLIYIRGFRYHPSTIFEPTTYSSFEEQLFAELNDPFIPLSDSRKRWIKDKIKDNLISIFFAGDYETRIKPSKSIFDLLTIIMAHCDRFRDRSTIYNLLFKIITANIGTSTPKLKSCDLHPSAFPSEILLIELDRDLQKFNLLYVGFSYPTSSNFRRKRITVKISQISGMYLK